MAAGWDKTGDDRARLSTLATVALVSPTRAAISLLDQRGLPGGGVEAEIRMMRSVVSGDTAWSLRPTCGRVARPETPCSAKRRRIRETWPGERLSRLAISEPAMPSAESRITRTRRA